MSSWSPQQYLKFGDLRARPCRDLATRVELTDARRVIDLGCGPGNLGDIAAGCWPGASILGIDSSPAMIETARAAHPEYEWRIGDIVDWAGSDGERYDVVFSNAALQWVPDHGVIFPRLFEHVAPGGALAVQMPGNYHAPPHQILREMAASPGWKRWFPDGRAREWHSHNLDFYYDALAPQAARLDLWATEYLQVMSNVEAIVEWYKATGLRPYLDPIVEDAERRRFLAEYLEKLRPHYPLSASGSVLFPFRRIFIVAYR
jgi:trans-aconitate 2-methyltransferase